MGVYYVASCDSRKELIDPGHIDDLGNKQHAISHFQHPFGSIVIFAMLTRWHGKPVRLAVDSDEDPGYFDYLDVTEDVLMQYNHSYNTHFTYTGRKRR